MVLFLCPKRSDAYDYISLSTDEISITWDDKRQLTRLPAYGKIRKEKIREKEKAFYENMERNLNQALKDAYTTVKEYMNTQLATVN